MTTEVLHKSSLWPCGLGAVLATAVFLLTPWSAVGVTIQDFLVRGEAGLGWAASAVIYLMCFPAALVNAYPASYVWVAGGAMFGTVFIVCAVLKDRFPTSLGVVWILLMMLLVPAINFHQVETKAKFNKDFSDWVSGRSVDKFNAYALEMEGSRKVLAFTPLRQCQTRQKMSLDPTSKYALTIDGVPAEKAQCGIINKMVWTAVPGVK